VSNRPSQSGSSPLRAKPLRWLALLCVVGLFGAAACGGGDDDGGGGGGGNEAGEPVRGGSVAYGLEAETSGGYCLAEAQLAIGGIQVARSMYDTLTSINGEGEYVPYLAESVEPNDDYTEWTIGLREGIKFHDGSDLTAEVVKNNLDAYRGEYPAREPLLFIFVLQNIDTVEVVDPLTVRVTMKEPWVAFPATLFGSGRVGMMAQAQLDDPETCDRQPIGTGPFKFQSWTVNEELVAVRNPDYWQEAPDGEPYPYLDEIRFRPIIEAEQRVSTLQTGDINAMHGSGAEEIIQLRDLAEADTVNLYESDEFGEVTHVMPNVSEGPLSDIRIRRAIAQGVDREEINQIINEGLNTLANGPFAPGSVGYLEDTGYPEFDLEAARSLVEEYENETGEQARVTYKTTPGTGTQRLAQLLKEKLEDFGIQMDIQFVEQAQLINDAIGGNFELNGWRNFPGGDPDTQYNWWKTGSPVNFGRFSDPEIDRLLDDGRTNPDQAERKEIYENLNRRFAEQIWNFWSWYTKWAIGLGPNVFGVNPEEAPKLPDGSDPFPGLATGHPVHGMWVTQ
jgi:peptide/nickel transport system substrate-binding protein